MNWRRIICAIVGCEARKLRNDRVCIRCGRVWLGGAVEEDPETVNRLIDSADTPEVLKELVSK